MYTVYPETFLKLRNGQARSVYEGSTAQKDHIIHTQKQVRSTCDVEGKD